MHNADSDIERALYKKDDSTLMFSHPKFGVDEIKDTKMKIDILVDEKNCKAIKNGEIIQDNFRELKK